MSSKNSRFHSRVKKKPRKWNAARKHSLSLTALLKCRKKKWFIQPQYFRGIQNIRCVFGEKYQINIIGFGQILKKNCGQKTRKKKSTSLFFNLFVHLISVSSTTSFSFFFFFRLSLFDDRRRACSSVSKVWNHHRDEDHLETKDGTTYVYFGKHTTLNPSLKHTSPPPLRPIPLPHTFIQSPGFPVFRPLSMFSCFLSCYLAFFRHYTYTLQWPKFRLHFYSSE